MYVLFFCFFTGFSIFIMLTLSAVGIWPVWGAPALFFIFGLCTYIFSMFKYRELRAIRDTATSKIGSLPMGFVEVCGKAVKHPHYHSIYRVLEVKEIGGRRRGYYADAKDSGGLSRSEFSLFPFYIDDGTGRVYINPQEAKIIANTNKWIDGGYYYEETEIKDGDEIYCLGTAGNKSKNLQAEIYQALKDARSDKYFTQKHDTDYDGKISQKEWDAARKKISGDVIAKSYAASGAVIPEIGKGTEKKLFIISNKSEKMLIRGYLKKTIGLLILGITVIVCSLVDVFMRLNVFPKEMVDSYMQVFHGGRGILFTLLVGFFICSLLFVLVRHTIDNREAVFSFLFKRR